MNALDDDKINATKRMRRVATGILIFLTCVFGATFTFQDPSTVILLIRAMAEAGIVGGLADWFAVEALFRHPLGIPIPHTALLPSNQKRAANNIARFIDENFLVPDQLLVQIRKIDPVQRLASWLVIRKNAQIVGRELSHFLHLLVKNQLQTGLGATSGTHLARSLITSLDTKDLSNQITHLLKGSMHGHFLDEVLQRIHGAIDANRDKISDLVQERSRWWIASSVDNKIVSVLVDGVLSIMDELSKEGSDLRREFEDSLGDIVTEFGNDGVIAEFIDQGIDGFVETPEFSHAVEQLIETVMHSIELEMSENPERLIDGLTNAVTEFSQMLLERPKLQAQLNDRLISALKDIIEATRPAITIYVAQTISDWDPDVLVDRMETEVGHDLQFIRINGSILGAFVGGVLFFITHFLILN